MSGKRRSIHIRRMVGKCMWTVYLDGPLGLYSKLWTIPWIMPACYVTRLTRYHLNFLTFRRQTWKRREEMLPQRDCQRIQYNFSLTHSSNGTITQRERNMHVA